MATRRTVKDRMRLAYVTRERELLRKELLKVVGLLRDLNPRSRFSMNPPISAIQAAAWYLDEVDHRGQPAPGWHRKANGDIVRDRPRSRGKTATKARA